ncbi:MULTISPECIES: hypothetical protein [unclassified Bradyrhizobium]|uniref:hypothetical protein n=1 Tax=unclassified Bradyrhizobium TaxID=2631580 RepID=UPI001FDA4371|nr:MULTISPECIES: hypothetical protein [unclassified Bradyrhizobium]
MATNGRDKSGRVRIRCSAATESGTCPDAKTFYLDTVESAVLNGLKAELRAPKVISEYVRTYLEERKRLAATSHAKRQRLERKRCSAATYRMTGRSASLRFGFDR